MTPSGTSVNSPAYVNCDRASILNRAHLPNVEMWFAYTLFRPWSSEGRSVGIAPIPKTCVFCLFKRWPMADANLSITAKSVGIWSWSFKYTLLSSAYWMTLRCIGWGGGGWHSGGGMDMGHLIVSQIVLSCMAKWRTYPTNKYRRGYTGHPCLIPAMNVLYDDMWLDVYTLFLVANWPKRSICILCVASVLLCTSCRDTFCRWYHNLSESHSWWEGSSPLHGGNPFGQNGRTHLWRPSVPRPSSWT